MNKKEKETAYKVKNLLLMFAEETKRDYLRDEAMKLIRELEKSLD